MKKTTKCPFEFTPKEAEQITKLKFSNEELKDWRLGALIYDLKINEQTIKGDKSHIVFLEKQLEFNRSFYQTKQPTKTINTRSNPESSRAFLKVV